jgi:hypothetical protein
MMIVVLPFNVQKEAQMVRARKRVNDYLNIFSFLIFIIVNLCGWYSYLYEQFRYIKQNIG